MSLLEKASQAAVTRRDLIKRGLIAAGGVLLAKEIVSTHAPEVSATRPRRVPVDRAKLPNWQTRVRIIEK